LIYTGDAIYEKGYSRDYNVVNDGMHVLYGTAQRTDGMVDETIKPFPKLSDPYNFQSEKTEDSTRLGSYITASTIPPIHFDAEVIREEAKAVAMAVWPICQKAEVLDDGYNVTYILTEQDVMQIVDIIGRMGYAVGSDLTDTQHPEIIRSFVKAIENKETSNIGIYSTDGAGRLYHTSLSYADGGAFVTTIDVIYVDGTPVVS